MAVANMELLNNTLGCSVDDFNYIIELIRQSNSFSISNTGDITSHINTLLGQRGTRIKGLLLLSSIIDTPCGQHVLDKVSTYVPLCLIALKSPTEQALGFSVLRQYLEKFSTVHELERSSINSFLPDILESLNRCAVQSKIQALKMLETLLNKYSKACGAHKSTIEKFLVPLVDCKDKQLVMYSAKCAHLLQQVRGGGEQGVNHKIAWINQYNLLLKSIVKTFSLLYSKDQSINDTEDEVELTSNMGPLQTCLEKLDNLTNLTEASQNCNPVTLKALRLTTRLENLFTFLQAMIVEPFPVSKKMNCKYILDILMKCLSAVCGTHCASKTEPSLHCAVMNTLRALCVSLKSDILPYFTLILRMILQTLEWSKNQNEETDQIKPFINVRKSAYHSLSSLLKCVRSCKPPVQRGDLNIEDALLENTLRDICPKANVVELTMTNIGGPKPMNKKERRRVAMAVNALGMPDNIGQPSNRTKWCSNNMELTVAAIDCLRDIIMCMGNFLKPNSHKLIQEAIISLFYETETPVHIKNKLSIVLSSVMDCCSSSQPAVSAHCIHLYSSMQNNSNSELSWISQRALRSHLSSLRGFAPPLQFSAAPTSLTNKTSNVFTSHSSSVNFNDSTLIADDVIEVDIVVSSSEESQDVTSNNKQTNNSSKKRKRSTDGGVFEKFQNRNKLNSNVSTPESKRSKTNNIVIDVEESVEISDCSNNSVDNEDVVLNEQDGRNGNNVNDELTKNVNDDTSNKTNENNIESIEERNIEIVNDVSEENIRVEILNDSEKDILNEKNIEDKSNDTLVSASDNNLSEDKIISVEEMMGAFVDDVNEELK